ncbi:hypothetical protein [Streptomyces hiroshimensis]|uniref:Secreted protein n=1 Tax=Streptomyces hiroshimensis TaxID=66424 RepID=A0ABQ2Z9S7_9ACTN|nr:hypothetical protein [Streptomyces hiroshimensis]GGY05741.1 hypothetical protein GCM10010324_60720 [Streptomyces hiroshimensis]
MLTRLRLNARHAAGLLWALLILTLSDTNRSALAFYRGNVTAVALARRAATSSDGTTAGAPVPERTHYRALATELIPPERTAWRTGTDMARGA